MPRAIDILDPLPKLTSNNSSLSYRASNAPSNTILLKHKQSSRGTPTRGANLLFEQRRVPTIKHHRRHTPHNLSSHNLCFRTGNTHRNTTITRPSSTNAMNPGPESASRLQASILSGGKRNTWPTRVKIQVNSLSHLSGSGGDEVSMIAIDSRTEAAVLVMARTTLHLSSVRTELSGYRMLSVCSTVQPANILISNLPFRASRMPGTSRTSFSI